MDKKEYMKKYNTENREKIREYNRTYQKEYYYAKKNGLVTPRYGNKRPLPDLPFPITRNEKLNYFRVAGWYIKDKKVYTNCDNIWKDPNCVFQIRDKRITVRLTALSWYLHYDEYPPLMIMFKNGDNTDYSIDNLIDRKTLPKKTQKTRVKKDKKDVVRARPKYLDSNELTYEIILSQGKGYLTETAHLMLYKLCENLITKFTYKNEDISYDVKMYAFSSIIESWMGFDFVKYNGDYSSFSYFTELAKRAMARGLKEQCGGVAANSNMKIPKLVSLNSFYF